MNTALLVIDVQESFRARPGFPSWSTMSDSGLTTKVAALVDNARLHSDLVVWVLHADPGSGTVFDPVQGHVRLLDGLVPASGEPVLTKTSHNAFTTTDLQRRLVAAGVGRVAVCGIRTEQCCETTARVASDLGYDVDFVLDATATQPLPDPHRDPGRTEAEILADPATLTTGQIMQRTAWALAGRFATVTTTADYLAARPRHVPA